MIAKVGSILKGFTVHRLDGSVERYDTPIHNFMSSDHFTSISFFGNGTAGENFGSIRYLGLCEHRAARVLAGIGGDALGWNETSKVLSNIDVFSLHGGSESTAGTYVLETGETAQSISGNAATGTVTLSNNSFGSSIAGKRVYQFYGATSTDRASNATAAARSASYSNGVITSVNTMAQVVTLTANRTIYSLRFASGTTASVSGLFAIFDLPTPLNLLNGETVTVAPGDFVTTYTFDDYQPRAFTAPQCPIAGISASGRVQRLLPIFGTGTANVYAHDGTLNAADTRIWLVSDANKITPIPNYQPNILLDETYITGSPIETINPTYLYQSNSTSSDYKEVLQMWGSVLTGGTVKQIVAGRTNPTTPLGWVIEFDTPQSIPAGKVLYFKTEFQTIPDIAVPSYTTNP